MAIGIELMARPKKAANAEKPADDRAVIIHLKGTADYAAWLDDMHKQTRLPKATIVRLGLEAWARENGKPAPPEF